MGVVSREETFVDFEVPLARVPMVRSQRSTTVLAEIGVLRAMGFGADYERYLGDHGAELLGAVPGTWIPLATLIAHYEACSRLPMSSPQQVQFGSDAAERVVGTLLGTAAKLATTAGASPWTFFTNVGRFWARGYDGGGLRVVKLGVKEARVELAGNPLFEFPFFRNGFRGYALVLLGHFCRRVWVREEPCPRGLSAVYRGQWA